MRPFQWERTKSLLIRIAQFPIRINGTTTSRSMHLADQISMDRSLCYCSLVDPRLAPQEHLGDCVLEFMDPSLPQLFPDDFNSASPTEDDCSVRRRKHRESMARLRQIWRSSIAALQRQERELQYQLQNPLTSSCTNAERPVHPLEVLRHSYCQLVQEQLQLQQERINLEATQIHRVKFERLLQRELERARLFRATSKDTREE